MTCRIWWMGWKNIQDSVNEFNTDPVRLMRYYDYFVMRRSAK